MADPRTYGRELANDTYIRIHDEGLTASETATVFGIKLAQSVRDMEVQGWSRGAIADWVEIVGRDYADRLYELMSGDTTAQGQRARPDPQDLGAALAETMAARVRSNEFSAEKAAWLAGQEITIVAHQMLKQGTPKEDVATWLENASRAYAARLDERISVGG
jgi:hypothetical protein